ncbi:40S ribosomal protein S11 [Monoraphidium neglectum]|uniref:40S ribosomal protein S11 n=1 Tax=Monoraphidium neglectum TaxID=145388 RepID=A0A0D2J656_9CHLO|nr:40S ribosomal protein S11 [Monoraphidium neglectum]KIY95367.1 40S ribosomal protein S11 [Monoraphidium neglectum]|eukprot:XP_013894387.1 40S ribosomal protein S11 [Monoraphidium neglectum]
MAEQTERAYQKQLGSNIGFRKPTKKIPGKFGQRYYKNVGLSYKTPREAIEGTYIDKKCPFTGNVSIRGRILTGVVKSTKMTRTIVVRRDYLHYIKNSSSNSSSSTSSSSTSSSTRGCDRKTRQSLAASGGQRRADGGDGDGGVAGDRAGRQPGAQRRYEKRHTNISAHLSPAFRCREGDRVEIGQCRPLSKTVRFNVLRVIPASGGSDKKGFSGF